MLKSISFFFLKYGWVMGIVVFTVSLMSQVMTIINQ